MDIVTLTLENLDKEHICCAISKNSDVQVLSKSSQLNNITYTLLISSGKRCEIIENCNKKDRYTFTRRKGPFTHERQPFPQIPLQAEKY